MKSTFLKVAAFGLVFTGLVTSCKKDKNDVETPDLGTDEQEVITTLTLMFTDSSDVNNVHYATFRDPDGSGGVSYDIFDTIQLQPNKTWYTSILVLDETASPVDTVSVEIYEKRDEHEFFFIPTTVNATVAYNDVDDNGYPVGLQTIWHTGATSNGTMQVVLKHQPGVKDGTMTPGESDIDVTFQMKVE